MKNLIILLTLILVSACNTEDKDILKVSPTNKPDQVMTQLDQSEIQLDQNELLLDQNKALQEILAQGFKVPPPGFTHISVMRKPEAEIVGTPEQNAVIQPGASYVPITNQTLIAQIGQYQNQLGPVALSTLPDLDWNNPTMASMVGQTNQMIVVKEIGYSSSNNINWSVGIHYDNGVLGSAGILKMHWIVPEGDRVSSSHYTMNLDPLFILYLNNRNKYAGVVHYANGVCWELVQNCIASFYFQNGGWHFLFWAVFTYLNPEFVLALAIACTVFHCY